MFYIFARSFIFTFNTSSPNYSNHISNFGNLFKTTPQYFEELLLFFEHTSNNNYIKMSFSGNNVKNRLWPLLLSYCDRTCHTLLLVAIVLRNHLHTLPVDCSLKVRPNLPLSASYHTRYELNTYNG